MTASDLPGASEMLNLLGELRETLQSFSEREARIERDYLVASTRLRKQVEQEAGAIAESLSVALQEIKTNHLSEKSFIERHFDLRKTHIKRAQENCRTATFAAIEEDEGRRKFEIQRDQLQATRTRDEEHLAERKRFEQFSGGLTTERDALAEFENQALSMLDGYPSLQNQLRQSATRTSEHTPEDAQTILAQFKAKVEEARRDLESIRKSFLPLLFKFLPVWLLIVLSLVVCGGLVPLVKHLGTGHYTWPHAGIAFTVSLVAVLGFYYLGRRVDAPRVKTLIEHLETARGLFDACGEASVQQHQAEMGRVTSDFDSLMDRLNRDWKRLGTSSATKRAECEVQLKERLTRALSKNGGMRQARLERLEKEFQNRLEQHRSNATQNQQSVVSGQGGQQEQVDYQYQSDWNSLATEWNQKIDPLRRRLEAVTRASSNLFPAWETDWMTGWTAPESFAGAARLGEAAIVTAALAGVTPNNPRLDLAGLTDFKIPLCLTFPAEGSLVIETAETGREQAISALNNIVIRLLASAPPGRLQFTLLDPVELGQSFAGIMHLADYEDRLINGRIWTQVAQIEEQLARLNEHIEKVAQMYLRNEYATIADYNEQAGRIAEKYHFLVIADFPVNFSDMAARRLQSILASGPRCGVFTLLHYDTRRSAPADFVMEEMHKNCVRLRIGKNGVFHGGDPIDGVSVSIDAPPPPELATPFLHKIGQASIDSNRVEVPFADVIPSADNLWSLDTTSELRVPIGRTGATKLQYFALGKGTRQHALVAGKTGSGKSTLFHVIISNLALWCSPEQVEFYLVDFKKGVEFKCYATHRLPHARVVAIESDREFGLSVLERVDQELQRRGELFRKLGAQDIAGYKRAGGTEPMPRTLLLIDEFQEFFTEDDRVSQGAALLLDRIVRQGRAFGIHVLLGSQTLGGAYTLARATLGQMAVRIALQCNEADAYLIMDEENPAPRLLTRPGEAIYNDTAGTLEGNSPFQIVWLSDEERDRYLEKACACAATSGKRFPTPVIFEGNAPADISENVPLRDFLDADTLQTVTTPRAFLGAPNAIKGPTEAVFHRQSGNHLLIVGQRDEATLAMLGVSLISLAAQQSKGGCRFILMDASPPDSPARRFLERVVHVVPQHVRIAQPHEVESVMTELAGELESRSGEGHGAGTPSIFLMVHELPKFKKLRYEEDFAFSLDDSKAAENPGIQFNKLIVDGASLGLHVLCACDTYNNLNRLLSRKAIAEFEMRVLFQMSANDSAALIDSPKAGELGLHRAILSNGAQGWMETFRPYSLPDFQWIEDAGRRLRRS